MKNCVLSQDGQLLNFKGLPIQCGLTTVKAGDFSLNGSKAIAMEYFLNLTSADRCMRMAPKHSNHIVYGENNSSQSTRVFACDGIIYEKTNQGVLSFLHCGWKSLAQNIIEAGVRDMTTWCQVFPNSIKAIIYSGICPSCYLVKNDVFQEFLEKDQNYKQFFTLTNSQGYKFDLAGLINWQLIKAGLSRKSIHRFDLCSHHHCFLDFDYPASSHNGHKFLLFSQRRDEEKRNFFFAKLPGDNTVITGTTGNCPYVVLHYLENKK
jgi:hypothetical protein